MDLRFVRRSVALALLTYAITACAPLRSLQAPEFCSIASDLTAFEGREVRVEGEYINAHPHGEIVIRAGCKLGVPLVLTSRPQPEGRDDLIRADVDAIRLQDYKRRIFARFTGIVRRSASGSYLDVRRVDHIRIVSGGVD